MCASVTLDMPYDVFFRSVSGRWRLSWCSCWPSGRRRFHTTSGTSGWCVASRTWRTTWPEGMKLVLNLLYFHFKTIWNKEHMGKCVEWDSWQERLPGNDKSRISAHLLAQQWPKSNTPARLVPDSWWITHFGPLELLKMATLAQTQLQCLYPSLIWLP